MGAKQFLALFIIVIITTVFRKRLKAEQRLISELSDYNKSIKGGDFRCNNSFPYQIVASIKFGYLST